MANTKFTLEYKCGHKLYINWYGQLSRKAIAEENEIARDEVCEACQEAMAAMFEDDQEDYCLDDYHTLSQRDEDLIFNYAPLSANY